MTRPIGSNIRAVCALLEVHGVMTSGEIHRFMPDTDPATIRKYCSRAVGHKLVSVNRMSYPFTYKAIPGWQGKLGDAYLPETIPNPIARPSKPVMRRVASVWDLGAMA